jgi:HEAT repeat protein
MHVGGAARLYAYNVLWRATGSLAAGRKLLKSFDSGDEDLQSLAGMLLVQAGRKAEPLLDEALAKREHLPFVLTILGDIGDSKYEPELRNFADDPDPRIAAAARDALRVLGTQSNRQTRE